MPRPAYIVEGDTEQRIIQSVCPGVVVQKIGVNGDRVSMETMARFLCAKIRALNNRNFPIIVIFDRERRPLSCSELRLQLLDHLRSRGVDVDQLKVCIADRCIESWLVPFLDGSCGVKSEEVPIEVDAVVFKGAIKELYRRNRRTYVETIDGVHLFRQIGPRRLAKHNENFRLLAREIADVCSWIKGGLEGVDDARVT